MKRLSCGACGYEDLETFLDLGYSPIADAYVSSPDEESETHPLQLAFCTGCRLVQLLEVVDHETLFGTGYSFYSSASPPLSRYHERYAEDILAHHSDLARKLTLEIGCNDGDFLRHFKDAGCRSFGVDPAAGPVEQARSRGLHVIKKSFGYETAQEILQQTGPVSLIVANHVLAHVESVSDFIHGISHVLADDGVVYIEVQYLPDLLVNNAFDLVYHEHRNFFSLTSLEYAVQRWGLHVVDAALTDRQGGSLRVALSRQAGADRERDRIRHAEAWLRDACAYRGFQGRVDRIRERLGDLVFDMTPIIGYGAPAKATTLLNFCQIDNHIVLEVIDTTPAKQGRYIPGTGIPIVSPQDSVLTKSDTVLLLAWNYASQIIRNHANMLASGSGRWIVPIPTPMVI